MKIGERSNILRESIAQSGTVLRAAGQRALGAVDAVANAAGAALAYSFVGSVHLMRGGVCGAIPAVAAMLLVDGACAAVGAPLDQGARQNLMLGALATGTALTTVALRKQPLFSADGLD